MPQPPNMQKMLQQFQKMQQDMLAAQEALKDEQVEASAGGGMVHVVVSGDLVVKSIRIDPEAIDPEDPELLQDMVASPAPDHRAGSPPRHWQPDGTAAGVPSSACLRRGGIRAGRCDPRGQGPDRAV